MSPVKNFAAYDILSEDLKKPERPEIIPATIYPDVVLNEYLDFDAIISNVVGFHLLYFNITVQIVFVTSAIGICMLC